MGKLMLERLGYKVITANNAGAALEAAREEGNDFSLLITDVIMPEMDGRELTRRLKELRPDLKTLFMSGYTANVIAHHGVLEAGVHFMEKPFSLKSLNESVRKALEDD